MSTEVREGVESPGADVTGCYGLQCGCWDLNLGPYVCAARLYPLGHLPVQHSTFKVADIKEKILSNISVSVV